MKQKAHFFHVSKTGGTAVKHALRNHLNCGEYEIILHGHPTRLRDIPMGDKVFFILRDPISRFISGFYSRQRNGLPRYNGAWGELETELFSKFDTPNDLAREFSDQKSAEYTLANEAMTKLDHIKTYYQWFHNLYYFKSRLDDILHIGLQETLSESFDELKDILQLPRTLSLPEDDFEAHRNPENLDKALDQKCVSKLKKWYEEDYQLLHYCQSIQLGV